MTVTEPAPGTDLAIPEPAHVAPAPIGGMSPRSVSAKVNFANALAQADLLPNTYRRKPGNVLLAVEYGEMLQMHPLTAIQQVHVIEGKLSMSSELMRAMVHRAGHRFRVLETSSERAVVQVVRSDDPDYPTTITFTMGDADRAKVTGKDNWKKYPAAMLLARATSAAVRAACPEVCMGISYVPEELGADVDDEGNVLDVGEASEPPAAHLEDLSTTVTPGWAKTQIVEAFGGDKGAAVRAWALHFQGRLDAGEGLTVGDVRAFLANATVDQFHEGAPTVEDATGDEAEVIDDRPGEDLETVEVDGVVYRKGEEPFT
jgi:hypothetical protein